MKVSQNQMITQMMTSRSQWCQNQERRASAQSRFLRPRILLGRSGRTFPNRSFFQQYDYPARALRALGLLLADGAPTVGRGKTF